MKVYGRCAYGALDGSNLRPYKRPSGKRLLRYATLRPRLGGMPLGGGP